jgi:hypothetical protein
MPLVAASDFHQGGGAFVRVANAFEGLGDVAESNEAFEGGR